MKALLLILIGSALIYIGYSTLEVGFASVAAKPVLIEIK
jgi:hypothetical protein